MSDKRAMLQAAPHLQRHGFGGFQEQTLSNLKFERVSQSLRGDFCFKVTFISLSLSLRNVFEKIIASGLQ